MERRLIDEYERTVSEILDRLAPGNHEAAVALARVPESIKGFGHIKLASVEAATRRAGRLVTQLRSAAGGPDSGRRAMRAAAGGAD